MEEGDEELDFAHIQNMMDMLRGLEGGAGSHESVGDGGRGGASRGGRKHKGGRFMQS